MWTTSHGLSRKCRDYIYKYLQYGTVPSNVKTASVFGNNERCACLADHAHNIGHALLVRWRPGLRSSPAGSTLPSTLHPGWQLIVRVHSACSHLGAPREHGRLVRRGRRQLSRLVKLGEGTGASQGQRPRAAKDNVQRLLAVNAIGLRAGLARIPSGEPRWHRRLGA